MSEPLDLAALGRQWTPQQPDAAPEVSDVLAEMPWWAARGALYLMLGFIAALLVWANFSEMDTVVSARGAFVRHGSQAGAVIQIANQDIAQIREDLPVQLKIDAYPFQNYGSVPAAVAAIAADASPDSRLGSVYPVTLTVSRGHILVRGKPVPLRSGLTLTADIVTGRQTLLSIFLSPFRRMAAAGSSR